MLQELKFQLSTAILTILTVAAAISAFINFTQQWSFHLPDDGVTWIDLAGTVQALRVVPDSGGANAGLRAGDALRKINALPIANALYVPQALATIGVWNKADYLVARKGVEFKTSVIVQAVPRDPAVTYQYLVGVAYLIIGLFVYYRRGAARADSVSAFLPYLRRTAPQAGAGFPLRSGGGADVVLRRLLLRRPE